MSAALRVQDARISRGGREIVRGVSFELRAGEVVGVLGPSGAGKSTLFHFLAGGLDGAGAVHLGAHRLDGLPLWRRARLGLGLMPQEPSVLFDLSVADNLAAYADAARTPPGAQARADEVGLSHRLEVLARDLSAGERRRLELLRATTHSPSVLLCDEPFAGVDPKGAERLGQLLRARADAGAAVLLADHHVEEALAVCDRAMLLLDGELAVMASSAEAFRADPLVRGRYLGTLHPSTPGG